MNSLHDCGLSSYIEQLILQCSHDMPAGLSSSLINNNVQHKVQDPHFIKIYS